MSQTEELRLGIIYALVDPLFGDVRYVGQTRDKLAYRWQDHIKNSKNKRTKKECWIFSRVSKVFFPHIEEIDSGIWDQETLDAREIYWIKKFSNKVDLTNSTEGGQGPRGVVVSDETRALIGQASKNAWQNLEYRENLAAKKAEYWEDNDRAREAVSRQSIERWSDPSYKTYQTFASVEYRQLRSEIAKEIWSRPEMKEVQSANGTKNMKVRRKCNECDYESSPAVLGTHFKKSGHSGYTTVSGE